MSCDVLNGWMRNAGRKINLIAILSFLFCNISFSQIIPDSIYGNRPKYMMHYDKKIIRHIYILNELVPLKSNPKQKKIIKKAVVTVEKFDTDFWRLNVFYDLLVF